MRVAPVRRIEVEPVFPVPPEAQRRLQRLRRVAWLMDRSIPIGGGRRIGLDPIIGLIPGIGDWLGAAISGYLIYEAIRLGVPLRVLGRMVLNIAIEATVGAIPVLGDLFDAAWQANQRNLKLVEQHFDPTRTPRSVRGILVAFVVAALVFLVAIAVLAIYVVDGLLGLFATS